MLRKRGIYAILGGLVLILALGVGAAASGVMTVRDPETARGPVITPPLVAPPGEGYTSRQAGTPVKAPDGRPVAQLKDGPAHLSSVSVNFPEQRGVPAGQIAYAMLAGIRYEGGGNLVLVLTMKPSPAAAQQPTTLGNQTVRLEDGSVAYVSTGMPGEAPNRIVQVRGDLIVVVSGNLPIDQLQTLMTQAVIQ